MTKLTNITKQTQQIHFYSGEGVSIFPGQSKEIELDLITPMEYRRIKTLFTFEQIFQGEEEQLSFENFDSSLPESITVFTKSDTIER